VISIACSGRSNLTFSALDGGSVDVSVDSSVGIGSSCARSGVSSVGLIHILDGYFSTDTSGAPGIGAVVQRARTRPSARF
jgi:hypothetical protein